MEKRTYKILGYRANGRQYINKERVCTPDALTERLIRLICATSNEFHVIFDGLNGQMRVAFCTQRRLNEIGREKLKAEMLAYFLL